MPTNIVLKLDAARLACPDADIRHALPDLLAERSGFTIYDDGYDYGPRSDSLIIYLTAVDVDRACDCIIDLIENVRVLGNDLTNAVVVAVEGTDIYTVMYPSNFDGSFTMD